MQRFLVALLELSVVCGVAAACSRAADEAPPVATPSAALERTDVSIGSPVDVTFRFAVAQDAPAFGEDYLVFVHYLDDDRELLWTDDHEPPKPTRQWKPGELVEYTRTMFVPKMSHTGRTDVEVGLYSRSTGERLPMAGEDAGMRSYRVATFNTRLQSDNVFVVFGDGWHDTEVGDETSGVEWQWSKKAGTISFRNPKRDVTLLLQVDQPVQPFPEPQRVEVLMGPTALDSFELPPGPRELRRIPLTAGQLGTGETITITITVDRTFVPASVPQLKSSDARELGIRVFRAYVQPR